MVHIRCQNVHIKNGRKIKCDKILLSIPQWILSGLKIKEGDDDGKLVLLCKYCSVGRFIEIKYIDGKLTFNTLIGKPDIGKEHKFQKVISISETEIVEESNGEKIQ